MHELFSRNRNNGNHGWLISALPLLTSLATEGGRMFRMLSLLGLLHAMGVVLLRMQAAAKAMLTRFGSEVLEVKCLDAQTASTLFAHYRQLTERLEVDEEQRGDGTTGRGMPVAERNHVLRLRTRTQKRLAKLGVVVGEDAAVEGAAFDARPGAD